MPFITLNRENQYQGHAFNVAKVHVRMPDGRERDYDLVEHGDSVTILPVDKDGNIFFVRQHRIGAQGELLELPAGVLNAGEGPLECAKREIREETGLAATHFQKLGGFYLAPGYTDEYMTSFIATDLYDSPLDPDDDEFIHVEAIPVAEAYHLAMNGTLQDGKTLATLMLAKPLLEKDLTIA